MWLVSGKLTEICTNYHNSQFSRFLWIVNYFLLSIKKWKLNPLLLKPWTILRTLLSAVWFYQLSLWDLISPYQCTQAYWQSVWNTNHFLTKSSYLFTNQNRILSILQIQIISKIDSLSLLWIDETINIRWGECLQRMLYRCILCCYLLRL